MSSLTENELIQQAMERQAKKLEYNRLYIKNRMANDPEFKKNQHAKSIACSVAVCVLQRHPSSDEFTQP